MPGNMNVCKLEFSNFSLTFPTTLISVLFKQQNIADCQRKKKTLTQRGKYSITLQIFPVIETRNSTAQRIYLYIINKKKFFHYIFFI